MAYDPLFDLALDHHLLSQYILLLAQRKKIKMNRLAWNIIQASPLITGTTNRSHPYNWTGTGLKWR